MAEETLTALHSGEVVTPEENLELGGEAPEEGEADAESGEETEAGEESESESGEETEAEAEAEPAAERKRKFKKVKR